MKKIVIAILFMGIICTGIGVYATIRIQASEIDYNGRQLDTVIDDLYNKANSRKNCLYVSGTKGTVGSKYLCDPGDGIARYFYILSIDDLNNTVDFIMDRNITQGTSKTLYTYTEAIEFLTTGVGKNIVDNWKNIINVSLPSAEAIAHATNYTNWTLQTDNGWFYFESHNTSTPNTLGTYAWLYDYLNDCATSKCNFSLNGSEASGYWTKDLCISDMSFAKAVYKTGSLTQDLISDNSRHGVRPVITVSSSQLSN